MLTKNETKLVIRHLRLWAKGDFASIIDRSQGICNNIESLLKPSPTLKHLKVLRVLADISEKWEYFSGNRLYPVPPPSSMFSAEMAYILNDNLWINDKLGDYINKRLMLCTFIADTLENP